jgi:hypothetical protein
VSRIATEEEHAKLVEFGRRLIAMFEDHYDWSPDSDDERSFDLGRLMVMSVLMAGNDVDWVNRPYLVHGLGNGLGVSCVVNPDFDGPLMACLTQGLAAGRLDGTAVARTAECA